jgi:hypothetical protein
MHSGFAVAWGLKLKPQANPKIGITNGTPKTDLWFGDINPRNQAGCLVKFLNRREYGFP